MHSLYLLHTRVVIDWDPLNWHSLSNIRTLRVLTVLVRLHLRRHLLHLHLHLLLRSSTLPVHHVALSTICVTHHCRLHGLLCPAAPYHDPLPTKASHVPVVVVLSDVLPHIPNLFTLLETETEDDSAAEGAAADKWEYNSKENPEGVTQPITNVDVNPFFTTAVLETNPIEQ